MEAKYVKLNIPDSFDLESENETIEQAKQQIEEILRGEFEEQRRHKCLIWDDIKAIFGTWIGTYSVLKEYSACTIKSSRDKNVFLTEKHAKRALAEAQISQLMPYYKGEITREEWGDETIRKYIVARVGNCLRWCTTNSDYGFIAFRTEEDRSKFMSRNENVQLVKDYFMLD